MSPLTREEAEVRMSEVPGWELAADAGSISRGYVHTDFVSALAFVNAVGNLAEREGHHPDIHLTGYKRVTLVLATHAIGGLSQNDFILAAKIDVREEGYYTEFN